MPSGPVTTPTEQAAPLVAPGRRRITAPALVDVRWLAANFASVRVIDTRRVAEHEAGRVPGSRSFPLDALLVEDSSRPAISRLAAAAQQALAQIGIEPDHHVVLIDDADGSASLGGAICELAGMRRVSVVHGCGVDAWQALGESLEQGPTATDTERGTWTGVEPRTGVVAAFEDVIDAVVDGASRVVDARSQLEHEGIVGSPCCSSRGSIPESVNLEWTAFFDMAGEPRSAACVAEIAAHVGLEPGDRIILTCHAGHRAAIAARVLRSVGFRDVRVSLGSWHEWCARGLSGDAATSDA
jgi:thiosulfate/3-mercaptopyruvate sulfurtransferase